MIKYAKPGAFIPGLPARDMPVDEWEAYPADVREWALSLGLYMVEQDTDEARPRRVAKTDKE